ncbi:AraC family transcriptional regulator [Nonlabens xiamenensis]|uniref:AraC family transcriptional regulator n=1 Tax=Nonlabens xiamenensis TaxID=2341043 RepID=UPI000F615418|nr:GyrI-like domain-containing protein [Nonlabens xiamenensis]
MRDKQQQANYQQRIQRVFEYIDENLGEDLNLEVLAGQAYFSPYHFHRIFKFMTDMTLNDYVTKRRMEKSAADLLHRDTPVGELAHTYGFADSTSFSKAFKNYFNISPTQFKDQNYQRFSKIGQLDRKNGQDNLTHEKYICTIDKLKKWIQMNATITITNIPSMELAYISSLGVSNLPQAYHNLVQWAISKGLMNDHSKMVTVYHDSFKFTSPEKVRISACILLDEPMAPEGQIGRRTIPEGKYIKSAYTIGVNEFEQAWTGLFVWMNEQGYQMADKEPFEIHHNNFNEHPQKKAIVDFYIPIVG